MTDFAKLLNDKMKKAADATKPAASVPPPAEEVPAPVPPLSPEPVKTLDAVPLSPSPSPSSQGRTHEGSGTGRKNPLAQERGTKGSNTNRVTVNLFDADRRALAIIKEHLANAGHDFTNRSDSIKIALRLAAKAQREDLAALFLEVRAEDRRFSASGDNP